MSGAGSVLVAGSANLDFVVRAAHVPAPGETVLGRAFETFPGGKGANQAVASARAGGAATRMLLALGDDDFAKPLEASLREAGVQLELIRAHQQPTGVAFVCLSDKAENAITVAPGANASLRPEHLPSLDGVSHLLMQLETPMASVEAWAIAARVARVAVVLNAAPAQALSAALLASIDMLIVNEGELGELSGVRNSIIDGMAALKLPCVVVTLGERGCCARAGEQYRLQPAFKVQAVDSTGAGDTFCGALVAALSQQMEFGPALRRACAASAIACTRLGAQTSVPTHAEVESMLANTIDDELAADELAAYCGFH